MSCRENKHNPCKKCEDGCLDYPEGLCIKYTGPETEFLRIPNGLDINNVIQGLDSTIAQLQSQVDNVDVTINTANTVSVNLTGNGTDQDLKGYVNISSEAGQTLQLLPDGLYVTTSGSGGDDATFTDTYFDL